MKKRELEKLLRRNGWQYVGGSKHEKWVKDDETEMLPRHNEITENLAKDIIKRRKLR